MKCCLAVGALSLSTAYATGGYLNLMQVSENLYTTNAAYNAYNIKSINYSIEFYGTNGGVGSPAWRSSIVRYAPTVSYAYAPAWAKGRHVLVPDVADRVSIVKDPNEFYADDIGTLVGNYLTGPSTTPSYQSINSDCGDEVDEPGDPDGAQESSGTTNCFAGFINNNAGLADNATVYVTVNYQDYNNAWHEDTVAAHLNRPGTTSGGDVVCFNPTRVSQWVMGDGILVPGPNSLHMLVANSGLPC
ncbi:MAG TPA: hypothetical protein VFW00_10740 [Rhodocyclaceae bacterium]|nr:hypothetical protein [Rhodocyclaceae bacterium]